MPRFCRVRELRFRDPRVPDVRAPADPGAAGAVAFTASLAQLQTGRVFLPGQRETCTRSTRDFVLNVPGAVSQPVDCNQLDVAGRDRHACGIEATIRYLDHSRRALVQRRPMDAVATVRVIPGDDEILAGGEDRRLVRVAGETGEARAVACSVIESGFVRQAGGIGHIERVAPGGSAVRRGHDEDVSRRIFAPVQVPRGMGRVHALVPGHYQRAVGQPQQACLVGHAARRRRQVDGIRRKQQFGRGGSGMARCAKKQHPQIR